jgi:hypothetical protein
MKVDDNDLWVLLMSTIRYAMGRRSYITGLAPDLVIKYWDGLDSGQLKQIAREIREEIAGCEAAGSTLGMQMDHDGWIKYASVIEKLANEKA